MAQYNNGQNTPEGPMMSFLFGAVAGALAVIFLDKDMRNKVENKLYDTTKKVKDTAFDLKDQAQDQVKGALDAAQDKIEAVKGDDHETANSKGGKRARSTKSKTKA